MAINLIFYIVAIFLLTKLELVMLQHLPIKTNELRNIDQHNISTVYNKSCNLSNSSLKSGAFL